MCLPSIPLLGSSRDRQPAGRLPEPGGNGGRAGPALRQAGDQPRDRQSCRYKVKEWSKKIREDFN